MTINARTLFLAGMAAALVFGIWLILPQNDTEPPNEKLVIQNGNLPRQFAPKEHAGGNVTVLVTPKSLTPTQPVIFELTFDTHSIELDFDIARASTLVDDSDATFGEPAWEGSPPGGHHRKGTLTFPKPLDPTAKSVTLTLRDIADIASRTFSWEVTQ